MSEQDKQDKPIFDWSVTSTEEYINQPETQVEEPATPSRDEDACNTESDYDCTPNFNNDPEGFTFNWIPLAIAAITIVCGFVDDWMFYLCLAIIVIIHELGHVVAGKAFGCVINKMQVFFFSFLSYKPERIPGGSSWRNITWSLGVLPFGGFTNFVARDGRMSKHIRQAIDDSGSSPFIDDKPAWQRLLISAGGVLFNFITFLILYFALPSLSPQLQDVLAPIASLSLILAVLNILPIYPLDGGAILFACYEITTGEKPSKQFTKVCGTIGFILIVLLFWVFPGWLQENVINKVFSAFF